MNFEEGDVRFSRGKQNQGIFVVIWNSSFSSKDRNAYCRTEGLNRELYPTLITARKSGNLPIPQERALLWNQKPPWSEVWRDYRSFIMLYCLWWKKFISESKSNVMKKATEGVRFIQKFTFMLLFQNLWWNCYVKVVVELSIAFVRKLKAI